MAVRADTAAAQDGLTPQLIYRSPIVTASATFAASLGIDGGKIVQIGGDVERAERTIDASGLLVLPGGVDVHTHLDAPGAYGSTADDFASGTVAAACGGTTTIVDFCQQQKGQTVTDALRVWHHKAAGLAAVDYGFHIIVVDITDNVLKELAALPQEGVSSFKLFMAYKGAQMVDDAAMIRVLKVARDNSALVMVHAENGDAIAYLQEKLCSEGKTAPRFHAESRPPRVESEATARAITLAETVGAPIYIVHVSCAQSLEEVKRGRERGVDVYAETCAHYLYTSAADLDRPNFEGAKFVFSPPARTIEDQQILWRALRNNDLQVISSDHGTWPFDDQRIRGRDDFRLIPNGATGIEERPAMALQGVHNGHFGLSRFVDIYATSPAKLFGLYPEKGSIAVGSDADLVLWNYSMPRTISQQSLHHANDFSLFEGASIKGAPVTVLLRGSAIAENGQFVGAKDAGRFVRRKLFERPW